MPESPPTRPTTVRLPGDVKTRLAELASESHHSSNGLICLAVESMLDFVRRTGKLPLAKKRQRQKDSDACRG